MSRKGLRKCFHQVTTWATIFAMVFATTFGCNKNQPVVKQKITPVKVEPPAAPAFVLPDSLRALDELASDLMKNPPAPLDASKLKSWEDFEAEMKKRTGESSWDSFYKKVSRLPATLAEMEKSMPQPPSADKLEKRLSEYEAKAGTYAAPIPEKIQEARQKLDKYKLDAEKLIKEIKGLVADGKPISETINTAVKDVDGMRKLPAEQFAPKMGEVLGSNGSVGKLLATDYSGVMKRYETLKPSAESFAKSYTELTTVIDELATLLKDKAFKDDNQTFKEEGKDFGKKLVTSLEAAATAFALTVQLFGPKIAAIIAIVVFLVVLLAQLFGGDSGNGDGDGDGEGTGTKPGQTANDGEGDKSGDVAGDKPGNNKPNNGSDEPNGIKLPPNTPSVPVTSKGQHGVALVPQGDGSVQVILAPNKVEDTSKHVKLSIPATGTLPQVVKLAQALSAKSETSITVTEGAEAGEHIRLMIKSGDAEVELRWKRPAANEVAQSPEVVAG